MAGGSTVFDHPATEAVAAIDDALGRLFEANVWSLPAGELASLLASAEKASRRLAAALVMLTAQADAGLVAEHEGATSLPALLRARCDVAPSATRARLRLHQALGERGLAREAFRGGQISLRSAQEICGAMAALPAQVPARLTAPVERLLVEVAKEEGASAVARSAAAITHRFAPDELERREAKAAEADRFALRLRSDGGIEFKARYGVEAAAQILPVLRAYAAPRPAVDGVPDTRDADTRHAQAFVDICATAGGSPQAPRPRGERPRVAVTISLEALRGALGAPPGVLDHGAPISAGLARRLACDATLIPIVLGAASEPLDVGRATRVWPAAIRRALEVRDGGCAMPGCDRPPSWCDAHHRTHWANGGETSVTNGVLLCARHHSIVHQDQWRIDLIDGLPWFIPPPWIDARQTARLHNRFKTRALDDP